MLVGRLLCSILPATLADRKLIAGAMLSGATAILLTIPLPGWPGALGAILTASFLMAGTWPTIVATTARGNAGRTSAVVGITVAAGSVGCILRFAHHGIAVRFHTAGAGHGCAGGPTADWWNAGRDYTTPEIGFTTGFGRP